MQRVQSSRNAGATVTDAIYFLAASYTVIAGLAFYMIWRPADRREWPYVFMYAVASAAWELARRL